MRPFDPRLLRYARTTRTFLAVTVGLGVLTALLVIATAWLVSAAVTRAFLHGAGTSALEGVLIGLGVVLGLRALVAWLREMAAAATSAKVKTQLRTQLLAHAVALGPAWASGERPGEIITLATTGIDALDAYFSRYLPQLVLAVMVPLAVLVEVVLHDWLSGLIIAVTLPLIPIFMIMVGLTTTRRTRHQWLALSVLAGHFLDVVAGLPTLKVFGRAKAQAETIREVTERYRAATMTTLRIAFLSAFVLELLATLSVALVAVTIGVRLVNGELGLGTGLFVLILAPEAYAPLRAVGAQFHASVEGVTAAGRIFEVLETQPSSSGGHGHVPDLAGATIRLEGVGVTYPGRGGPAVAGLDLALAPRSTTVLTGPSGAGKSTLVALLLGLREPDAGRVVVVPEHGEPVNLGSLDLVAWRAQIAWVPQKPALLAGTLAENIRVGDPQASDERVRQAARDAGLGELVDDAGDGLARRVGERGAGLSAGERQRLALARALVRDAPVLILDEPTANLDGSTEAQVLEVLDHARAGRTVLLVAHRPSLLALADHRVHLGLPTRAPDEPELPRPSAVLAAPGEDEVRALLPIDAVGS
ncbi:MAG: thiol reductant ABC exporter subunit CydD [Actinomycetes bacterium]